MVARGDKNELYVCGASIIHNSKRLYETIQNQRASRFYSDMTRTSEGSDNWTKPIRSGKLSRQEKSRSCIFGVEDHPDYHQTTDTFDEVNQDFTRKCGNNPAVCKSTRPFALTKGDKKTLIDNYAHPLEVRYSLTKFKHGYVGWIQTVFAG